MSIQQLVQSMAECLSGSAAVRNVYGDPVVAGDRTVIPAAEIRYAFGAGGGVKDGAEALNGGGGGRVSARPCGALEITPEGTRFIAFQDWRSTGAALAIAFVLAGAVLALTGNRRIEIAKRPE